MTIFFLGDSNFLISGSGYELFTKNSTEEVINLSVGASPSSVGIFVLPDANFCEGDVVFISYAVNEAAYILQGIVNSQVVYRHLSNILSKIISAGAHPIIVIFPSKTGLTIDLESDEAYRNFCKTTGVPLIDLADIIKRSPQSGCSIEQVMMDDAHIQPKLSSLIADLFNDAIDQVRICKPNIRSELFVNAQYRRLAADAIANEDGTIFRKSSLRGANMAVLKEGKNLQIALDESEEIHGMMINMGAPGGIVEIQGENQKSSTSLVTHWDNENPTSFMCIFVHLRQPVQGGDAGIQVRILPKNSKYTEPLLHDRTILPDLYGEVHIEGILVATASTGKFSVLDDAEPNSLIAGREAQLTQEVVRLTTTP